MKYLVTVEGETFEIEIGEAGQVWINGRAYIADFESVDGLPHYSLILDHRSYDAHVEQSDDAATRITLEGQPYQAHVHQQGEAAPRPTQQPSRPSQTPGQIRSPMSGLLLSVSVDVGQHTESGQIVAVVESMKMLLELQSQLAGTVAEVSCKPGEHVSEGQLLVTIRAD